MSSWHVEDDVWPHDKVIIAPDGTRWRLSSDEELGLLVATLEKERRRAEENAAKVRSLFDAIKHGDEEHQRWLQGAINEHFALNPDTSEAKGDTA